MKLWCCKTAICSEWIVCFCKFLHGIGQWNAPSLWSYEYYLIHVTDCHVPELTTRTNMVTLNMEHRYCIVAVLKRRRIEAAQYPSPPPPLWAYILQFFCNNVRIGPACQAVELPVFYHAIQQTHPPPNPVGRVDLLYEVRPVGRVDGVQFTCQVRFHTTFLCFCRCFCDGGLTSLSSGGGGMVTSF